MEKVFTVETIKSMLEDSRKFKVDLFPLIDGNESLSTKTIYTIDPNELLYRMMLSEGDNHTIKAFYDEL